MTKPLMTIFLHGQIYSIDGVPNNRYNPTVREVTILET